MNYHQQINEFREDGDTDKTLEFIGSIFKDVRNQKVRGSASDYLYDNDDETCEKIVLPAEGFDNIVAGFQPKDLDDRISFLISMLTPDKEEAAEDEIQRTKRQKEEKLDDLFCPLNAIVFRIGDYERCDAVADSGYYKIAENRFERKYGLNHEIIRDDDSNEEYDFVYEIENGDQYELTYNGERLVGKELYYDLKVALFSKYIKQIITALSESFDFSNLKKNLPFYFMIRSAEYRDQQWLHPIGVIDETSLGTAKESITSAFKAACPDSGTPTADQYFEFYNRYFDRPVTEEYKLLTEIVNNNPHYLAKIIENLHSSILAGCGKIAAQISRFLWTVVDQNENKIIETQQNIFTSPLPSLSGKGSYAGSGPSWRSSAKEGAPILEIISDHVEDYLNMLTWCQSEIPEKYFMQINPSFEEAITKLSQHENAAVRVLAFEANCTENEYEDDACTILKAPSDKYIDAVVATIELLAPVPEHGWSASSFVADRLTRLGEKAYAGIPLLIKKLEQRSKNQLDTSDVRQFASVLFAMGCIDVPEVVHRTHQENQFYIDEYKDWCARGPDKAWNKLQQAYIESPELFRNTKIWEHYLYHSEFGYKELAKELRASSIDDAAIYAATHSPAGPKLSKQLYELAHLIQYTSGRNKNYARAVEYLELIPSPDPDATEMLLWAKIAVAVTMVESFDNDASIYIAELRDCHPGNATLLFIDVYREVSQKKPIAAMQILLAGMPEVFDHDLHYQKSFIAFTGGTHQGTKMLSRLDLSLRGCYGLYKVVSEYFRSECFTGREFEGVNRAFKTDPFYQGIYHSLSGSRTETALILKAHCAEWDFLNTMKNLGEPALIKRLDPKNWNISSLIIQNFSAQPTQERLQVLLELFITLEDETQKTELSILLWPHLPDKLLEQDCFCQFLPVFYIEYRAMQREPLVRDILDRLVTLGKEEQAMQFCSHLNGSVALNTIKTFMPIFFRAGQYNRLADIFIKIANDMSKLKPEWTLAQNSVALSYIHGKAYHEAEEIFKIIFSQDTSRFNEGDDSDTTVAVIGESVAHQAARIFWIYWSSARFNYACLLSMTQRYDEAMDSLREAVKKGSYEISYIKAETDFEPLFEREDFKQLIQEMQGKVL